MRTAFLFAALVLSAESYGQTVIVTGPEGTTSIIDTGGGTVSIIHAPRPVEWPPGRK